MYAKDKTTILDRREMLRVKAKSLAAEAIIIRKEEKRSQGALRNELHDHRVNVVRKVARETGIAYGIIKGRTLSQMEQISYEAPDWDKIRAMVKKYGHTSDATTLEQQIAGWKVSVKKAYVPKDCQKQNLLVVAV